jgi:hypothetical protein
MEQDLIAAAGLYCIVYYGGTRIELTPDDYMIFVWDVTKLHRTDGPAISYRNGDESWYVYGKLHRLDGPARTDSSSSQYWINGEPTTKNRLAKHVSKIRYMPLYLRLIDDRWWVRELKDE